MPPYGIEFAEGLEYYLSLIDKRLSNKNLIMEKFTVGTLVQKQIVLLYLKNRVQPGIVNEIRNRIAAIKTETVLDSSYIERSIENSNWSPFPQLEKTLRPDVVEAALLQGRVAVVVDDSLEVLLAPATFFDLMDTPVEAYGRWFVSANVFRIIGYIMFLLAVSLPALYIAVTSFNPEMIPVKLAFLIAAYEQKTPFPVYFQAFAVWVVIEALWTVMKRVSSQIWSILTFLIFAILIGTGLITNIIGASVIIIFVLTMLFLLGIPNSDLRDSVRIIQLFCMIMATFLGLFGLAIAVFYTAIHAVNLKSFGTPFLAPLAPLNTGRRWHTEDQGISKKMDPKIIIPLILIGTYEFEVFTLSKGVVEIAGHNAWLCILLGGIFMLILTYLLVRLADRFQGENPLKYINKVWGKPLAYVIITGYLLFWFFYLTIMMENISMTNKVLFLPNTPLAVTLVLVAIGAVWLISYGYAAIVRLFQLALPFFIIPFIILAFIAASTIRIDNLTPVFSDGFLPVIKGSIYYVGVWQGMEVILFAGIFVTNAKAMLKPALLTIAAAVLLDFTFTVSAMGIIGVEGVKQSTLTGINTIRALQLPGFPIERFELFLTMPWLIGILTTICLYLYFASYSFNQFFNIENRKLIMWLIIILVIIVTYIIYPNTARFSVFVKNMNILSSVFLYIIPILTLGLAVLRNKKG